MVLRLEAATRTGHSQRYKNTNTKLNIKTGHSQRVRKLQIQNQISKQVTAIG